MLINIWPLSINKLSKYTPQQLVPINHDSWLFITYLGVKFLVYDTNFATSWGHDYTCVQTSKFFKQLTLTKPKITIKGGQK